MKTEFHVQSLNSVLENPNIFLALRNPELKKYVKSAEPRVYLIYLIMDHCYYAIPLNNSWHVFWEMLAQ